jgi:signal peptidase II
VIPPAEERAPAFELPKRPPLMRSVELVAIGSIVALDQLTKFIVRTTIPLYDKRTVIPRVLDLTHVQNTGAAFGVLNAADFPYKSALMIGIAALALVAISLYARQLGSHEKLSRYGLALILGGAFGNLIDRAIAGHVVDFVDV